MIAYEKMPRFCAACGFIGHSHLECGTGEHDEANLKWGDFLKADWSTWHNRGGFGGRGGRSNRGGRAGRGGREMNPDGRSEFMHRSWRHNAIPKTANKDMDGDALDDTASSPIKTHVMELDNGNGPNLGAKRNILDALTDAGDPADNTTIKGDLPTAMITDGSTIPEVVDQGKVDIGSNKRTKMDGADSSSLGSASSREELVRSQ
jgi:hypothetical protein